MADEAYTRTGNGALTKLANITNLVPFLRKLPVFGAPIGAMIGYLDTAIEAFGWLMRGKIGSAATVAITGAVSNTVNGLQDTIFWWANAASTAFTGSTLGTHSRALTEKLIESTTGALGMKPQVLSSHVVTTAFAEYGQPQQQQNTAWQDMEANRRGVVPEEYRRQKAANEDVRDHVGQMQRAQMAGSAGRA